MKIPQSLYSNTFCNSRAYQNSLLYSSICFIFLFGRIFVKPLKFVCKLALNSVLGGLLILVINYIGQGFNFHIGLNIFTSALIGLLGLPGAVLLIILQLFIIWDKKILLNTKNV